MKTTRAFKVSLIRPTSQQHIFKIRYATNAGSARYRYLQELQRKMPMLAKYTTIISFQNIRVKRMPHFDRFARTTAMVKIERATYRTKTITHLENCEETKS